LSKDIRFMVKDRGCVPQTHLPRRPDLLYINPQIGDSLPFPLISTIIVRFWPFPTKIVRLGHISAKIVRIWPFSTKIVLFWPFATKIVRLGHKRSISNITSELASEHQNNVYPSPPA
ncbi:hypothetical protein T08_12931, partial [Trichinella sp. T8]